MNSSTRNRTQYVIKRNGSLEPVSFDAIRDRIASLSTNLDIDIIEVSRAVIDDVHDKVKTSELDRIAADIAINLSIENPDYAVLASNLLHSDHHKNTPGKFSVVVDLLYNYHDYHGNHCPLLAKDIWEVVQKNKDLLDKEIDYSRDYLIDYFGFKTLLRSYLMRTGDKVIERVQDMWMRTAIGIWKENLAEAIKTYHLLSQKKYIHGTPTLYNSGTPRPQFNSCFLVAMKNDSLEGILATLNECSHISKWGGGIGFHCSNIRATGAPIRSTNGKSNGLVPLHRAFETMAAWIDQGGSKRKGSWCSYLEPWHADVKDWLKLKRQSTSEKLRAKDLFYALWIPDLFMKRVKEGGIWSLMCPDKCPGLHKVWGQEFEKLYTSYEEKKMYKEQLPARELWRLILANLQETGTPFILYKDACNRKSPQQNLGTIRSSNLCVEVVLYSDEKETAVCTLASLGLPSFVKNEKFDFEELRKTVAQVTRNLNRIIDISFYPSEDAKMSSLRHRPIGIGIQGLADVFYLMKYPYDSPAARKLNRQILENIYYAAVDTSADLAAQDGPYSTYEGSPAWQGKLQMDLWNFTESELDWTLVREKVKKYGLRNSTLLALMPTASTSQILGNAESFDPLTSNIFLRDTLAGTFYVINKYLVQDLISRGLWNEEIRDKIIYYEGSIQQIEEIPGDLKRLYRTAFELPMDIIVEMAADRGVYIDQSQSMNLYSNQPSFEELDRILFKGWEAGLKTGCYYFRTTAAVEARKTVVLEEKGKSRGTEELICRRDDPTCTSCHS